MGNRGKALARALAVRHVDIAGFSDAKSEVTEQGWLGVKGVAPDKIPKDAQIIITKDNPRDALMYLNEIGLRNIITYDEIEQIVMETIIDQERIKDTYNL